MVMMSSADVANYDRTAAQEVIAKSGQSVDLCYHCKKCTSGCPMSDEMDLRPNQVMRALQLGQVDRALNSKTIWLCASCATCSTRCPYGIDIVAVMDTLRATAQQRGLPAKVPSVPLFNKIFLRWVKTNGRMYEAGLLGELKMRMMLKGQLDLAQFKKDAGIGMKLFMGRKLKVMPKWVRWSPPKKVQIPAKGEKSIAFYPGCAGHSSGMEFDLSTRAVCQKLGLKLEEPEGWICCGSSPAHATSHVLATELPMKNLALIEAQGHDEVTIGCASCFSRFRAAIHDVEEDPQLKTEVARSTGYSYSGGVEVRHLVDTLTEQVGLEKIGEKVVKPLRDLKVVCYYGCLLTRPPKVTGADHHEYPMNMDNMVRKLGAQTLDWSYKTECCGASFSLTEVDYVLKLTRKILNNAKEVGAEAIVVACPLCHANLDTRQAQISQKYGENYHLPVFYFTELMGLAMGLKVDEVGLRKHLEDPVRLLREKGLLVPAPGEVQAA